jgi:3D (Asp-Asp-Asp) domain-containing protein
MASKDGIIEIALSNAYYYREALTDDFLIHPYTGSQNLLLGTSNTARMIIAPSNMTLMGPIGVNTSNVLDSEAMRIQGDVTVVGSLMPGSNITYDLGSSNMRWRDLFLSGNTLDIGGTKITADSSNNITLRDSGSNLKRIIVDEVQIGEDTSNNTAIRIKKNSLTNNVQFFNVTGGTETTVDMKTQWSNVDNTVFITGSNVAIGKTSAAFTLDVAGNINFTGDLYKSSNLYVSSQWSNLPGSNLAYTQGGIGIGTTTVTQALTVQGGLALRRSGLITSPSNIVGFLGTGGAAGTSSQWSNVSSNVFIIGSNVGIGTSNPQAALHVAGDIILPRRDLIRYDPNKPSNGGSFAVTYSTAGVNNLAGYVTYNVDATNGDNFVINIPGVYSINANMGNMSTSSTFIIDRNTDPTTLYGSNVYGNLLSQVSKGSNYEAGVSFVGFLGSNDTLRVKMANISSLWVSNTGKPGLFLTLLYRCG